MTNARSEGWSNFDDGDEADNVPLWQVLARFRSEDLDEGLAANTAVINGAKPTAVAYYNLAFAISLSFGLLLVLLLIGSLISAGSSVSNLYFGITLSAAAATIAPHLWRQIYQYGLTIPDAPLKLPHPPDGLFDEVLGYLQKVDGPKVYYLSRFRKRRVRLTRRQFFGRLRYFLFSEHSKDRAMVMRFPTAVRLPTDLYIHRDDVGKMLSLSGPKRRGGPGRNVKYAYVEAVFDLRADPRLAALDLNDETIALRSITNWLSDWFDSAANVSGDIPKRDQLAPYAMKIFCHLKRLASAKDR